MRNAGYVVAMLLVAGFAACGARATNTTATSAPSDAPAPVATPLNVGGTSLPAGPELTQLQMSCGACHSVGLVTQQRLSPAIWKAEVTKMRGFGAPLTAAQEPALVAYLARYLNPQARRGVEATATAPPITYAQAPR